MNRLDQFLNVAARSMRIMPDAKRDDELRELRGHLEQRAEDYANQGMSDDAAQARALESLGSPRALGAKLCDAWEGVPFSWWRLVAAIIGVTAFLLFAGLVLIFAISLIPMNSEAALLPEIVPILCALYIALPLFCGLLFSRWLGRRGCMVATLYFLALALGKLTVTFPSSSAAFAAPPANFVVLANAAWFAYFWVALAFIGAWIEHVWRMQMRYNLAIAEAHATQPKQIFWLRFNLKLWRNVLLFIVLMSALYAGRVWLQFHPQTPNATLRNTLLTASPQGFDAPEILELRQLPPASVAERAGREQRFYFRVAARAKPYFAANQIKYLEGQIKSQKRTKYGVFPATQAALKRVKNNRQIVEGTVTMVKTNEGWHADKASFHPIRLWEWFYDS